MDGTSGKMKSFRVTIDPVAVGTDYQVITELLNELHAKWAGDSNSWTVAWGGTEQELDHRFRLLLGRVNRVHLTRN